MYLVTAATEMEMAPVREHLAGLGPAVQFLVTGVGMLETATLLCCFLAEHQNGVEGVINLGVAGAFVGGPAGLLDLCLADAEVVADLGICAGEETTPFTGMAVATDFSLANPLRERAAAILAEHGISFVSGTFVSVNAVSATERRGRMLRDRHRAICENMEGAAVARVCQSFGIDGLELRTVSNLVEDRDPTRWRLNEAIAACAAAADVLIPALIGKT